MAWCPELGVESRGRSIEEALAKLKEAVELHLDDDASDTPTSALLTTIEVHRGDGSGSIG